MFFNLNHNLVFSTFFSSQIFIPHVFINFFLLHIFFLKSHTFFLQLKFHYFFPSLHQMFSFIIFFPHKIVSHKVLSSQKKCSFKKNHISNICHRNSFLLDRNFFFFSTTFLVITKSKLLSLLSQLSLLILLSLLSLMSPILSLLSLLLLQSIKCYSCTLAKVTFSHSFYRHYRQTNQPTDN